jgi:hypothetical protein
MATAKAPSIPVVLIIRIKFVYLKFGVSGRFRVAIKLARVFVRACGTITAKISLRKELNLGMVRVTRDRTCSTQASHFFTVDTEVDVLPKVS